MLDTTACAWLNVKVLRVNDQRNFYLIMVATKAHVGLQGPSLDLCHILQIINDKHLH